MTHAQTYAIGDVEAINCALDHRYDMYFTAKLERVRLYEPELVLFGIDVHKFLAIGRTKTLLDVDFVKGVTGKHYLAINDDDSVTCTAVLDAGDGVTEPKIISKDEWYDKYRYVHMRINNVAEYANTSEQRVYE